MTKVYGEALLPVPTGTTSNDDLMMMMKIAYNFNITEDLNAKLKQLFNYETIRRRTFLVRIKYRQTH